MVIPVDACEPCARAAALVKPRSTVLDANRDAKHKVVLKSCCELTTQPMLEWV
jgi:hypothetical protein